MQLITVTKTLQLALDGNKWIRIVGLNTQVYTLPSRNENEAVTQLDVSDFCKWSFGVENVVVFFNYTNNYR